MFMWGDAVATDQYYRIWNGTTLTAATLLWADLTNRYVWIVLGITLAFGAVGLWDDFLKVTKRNSKGVPAKLKIVLSVV